MCSVSVLGAANTVSAAAAAHFFKALLDLQITSTYAFSPFSSYLVNRENIFNSITSMYIVGLRKQKHAFYFGRAVLIEIWKLYT